MTEATGRVLVSAGSKHGATAEIAQRIGAALTEHGIDADVVDPEHVGDLSVYSGVILGSAVYAGHWVNGAKKLADRVAAMSPRPEVWLFSSGPIGDPPMPEEDPVDVADIELKTGAREHRLFAGKIDKSKLSFGEKAILVAVRASEGDFRDWEEIEAWAHEVARRVTKELIHR